MCSGGFQPQDGQDGVVYQVTHAQGRAKAAQVSIPFGIRVGSARQGIGITTDRYYTPEQQYVYIGIRFVVRVASFPCMPSG